MIGELGHLSGEYTVVGQVDQILKDGEQYPTFRLMHAAPVTITELKGLREIVGNFTEPAKEFGLSIAPEDATITGPAIGRRRLRYIVKLKWARDGHAQPRTPSGCKPAARP